MAHIIMINADISKSTKTSTSQNGFHQGQICNACLLSRFENKEKNEDDDKYHHKHTYAKACSKNIADQFAAAE